MQLNTHIQVGHVKEAARLIRAATYQALVDPLTGRIDFDQLHHGLSSNQRARQTLLGNYIVDMLNRNNEEDEIVEATKETITEYVTERLAKEAHAILQRRELDRAIEHFEQTRLIVRVHGNKYIRGAAV